MEAYRQRVQNGNAASGKPMKRWIAFILMAVLLSVLLATPAAAVGSVGKITEFNELDGDYQYLSSKYRYNYYLDIEELGILDSGAAIVNDVANVLFSIISFLGYCIVAFFYFCFSFDINELFGTQIEAIQALTKNTIFDSFFILAFAFAAWELAKKLFRRNLTGMMIDGAKIVLILLLSSFVVRYSATTLTAATNITKDLGVAALSGLNGGSTSTTSYAVSVSGSLWKSLVHDPWVTFEFYNAVELDGEEVSESDIQKILSKQPGSEERQAIIQDFAQDTGKNLFKKNWGRWRTGCILVYLIPFLVKSAVFVMMAVIQIAFQVMALFFVLLAPVILLMSLVPALGGIDLITLWLKKVFETQLMILIITFLIGVIVKVDALLYSKTPQLGWMIVILMETLISLIVFFNYKSIIAGIGKVNKVVRDPNLFQKQLRRSGDALQAARDSKKTVDRVTQNTVDGVGSGLKTVGKGSLNVAKRIKQISADSYQALADYYNSGDDSASDPAPAARRRIKTPSAAQPSPAGRRPVTADFKDTGAAPTGRRRSKVPYLDVAFVDVTDDKATAPRPTIPRAGSSDPKSDANSNTPPAQSGEKAVRPSVAAAQRKFAAAAAPAVGQKRPAASAETFRRPAASADAAPGETAVNRPSTPAAQHDAVPVSPGERSGSRPNAAAQASAPLGTAKADHAAAKPQPDKAPVPMSNAREVSPENKRQLRRPRAAVARRSSAAAGASEASPTGNQAYSAAMATFRRPTAASDIAGTQPVSRPSTTAPGNSAAPKPKGQEDNNGPVAAAVSGTSAAPAQAQPSGRPNTQNAPTQAATAPASAGSKAAVKVKPGGRATPPPAAPTAPQESRHVPHARVNMAQPPENAKQIERPTLQAASSKKASTPARVSRTANKPSRRPPTRSPTGAKIMPAGDAATTPRPAIPSKPK